MTKTRKEKTRRKGYDRVAAGRGARTEETKKRTGKIGCFVTGACTIRLRCRVKRINAHRRPAAHTAPRRRTHGPLGERKKMRKLSHFVRASIFIRVGFSLEHRVPVNAASNRGHARSSAGYYFSRRIFPQMNFMKTVFALLINRSSVVGPGRLARPRRPLAPAAAVSRPLFSPFRGLTWITGPRAQLLIIILFQGPRGERDAFVLPF